MFEATWDEFNLDNATWTIPSARSKNGAEHIVPLSDIALDTLRSIPRIEGSSFAFTTTGKSPVSGISKAKARLDQLITKASGGSPLLPWRLHDLRRTFVSGCARLRIPAEVTERAINHVSESFGGVRGVYNVHAYLDERRSAMQAWADHITDILTIEKPTYRCSHEPSKEQMVPYAGEDGRSSRQESKCAPCAFANIYKRRCHPDRAAHRVVRWECRRKGRD